MVFEQGAAADALYIVLAGAVELGSDGGQPEVILRSGAYFGEMSMLLELPRTRAVRAVEDCELPRAAERIVPPAPRPSSRSSSGTCAQRLQERLGGAPE